MADVHRTMSRLTIGLLLLVMLAPQTAAQSPSLGILGQPAPAWEVARWFNLPSGTDSLDIADLRGKVVYLFCFQSWCPGCHGDTGVWK